MLKHLVTEKYTVCVKCGSSNVEVTTRLPSKNEVFFERLLRKSVDRSTRFGPLAGSYYVICKDCGHVSLIQR